MPNAGEKLKTLHFPAAQPDATDGNDQLGITNTSPAPGSPEVSQTFVAPLSGQMAICIAAGLRGDSPNSIVRVEFQLFEGTSVSGTEKVPPSTANRIQVSDVNMKFVGRTVIVGGLTPGATHFVRLMQAADPGAGTIIHRALGVFPLP